MKTLVETMENFVYDLCKKIDNLTAHSYTANEQSAFLKRRKSELPADTAILILDFAENYQYTGGGAGISLVKRILQPPPCVHISVR